MNDIPCKCGHLKVRHEYDKRHNQFVCMVKNDPSVRMLATYADECFNYTPDNLTYIEQLAKRKGLV